MRLKRRSLLGDVPTIAKKLLGKTIHRKLNGQILSAYIVETEAYVGSEDTACHASKGKTERTSVMFGTAGHAYIYFVYGMHYMFNIVVGEENFPAAILVRAVEPLSGESIMAINRKGQTKHLTDGPAKFCQAFAIDKSLNKIDLLKSDVLWLEEGKIINTKNIISSARIGIDYAEKKDREKLWRFYVKGNKFVSR